MIIARQGFRIKSVCLLMRLQKLISITYEIIVLTIMLISAIVGREIFNI